MQKVHSTGGFWLLLGALLLAASLRLLFWFAVACAVHEAGHVLAIHLLGGRVAHFRLTGVGAVIQPRRERLFSYGEECLIALAGPLASLALAVVGAAWGRWFGGGYLLTGLSLTLGLFNLLPAAPLDGGRICQAAVSWLAGPDTGEVLCRGLTQVLGAALAAVGLWVLRVSGNFTLLLCAGWLLCRRRRGGERG